MSEHTAKFVVDAASGKNPDVRVVVSRFIPAGTMVVSPDVFSRLMELSHEDQKAEFLEKAWRGEIAL
jgi:hypothetical protein